MRCIICWMGNGYNAWQFIVAIDTTRDNLSQVNQLPFCTYILVGRFAVSNAEFTQPFGKIDHRGVVFLVSSINACSKGTPCMETPISYHINIFNMASYGVITCVTRFAKNHLHFSLNYYLVLSFVTKIYNFKRRWNILLASKYYANFSLFYCICPSGRQCH